MRCSSSPNENAWNACRDAVVTLVYGEDSFWIEAKDSPRRARIDVAARETAASTPALSGAVICSRPKTSPVAQFTALSEITYDVPSGAMVTEREALNPRRWPLCCASTGVILWSLGW